MRVALDEDRKVIRGFLCQATFSQDWGWWFINSRCLTSSVWTAENPAKALQKLCQLKDAGQNVVLPPWWVDLCYQSYRDSLQWRGVCNGGSEQTVL